MTLSGKDVFRNSLRDDYIPEKRKTKNKGKPFAKITISVRNAELQGLTPELSVHG